MLSAAKHLLFLIENKQKQILRCAQNDIAPRLFPQPVKFRANRDSSCQDRVAYRIHFQVRRKSLMHNSKDGWLNITLPLMLLSIAVGVAQTRASSQREKTAAAMPKFEVVSIKPSKPGARGGNLLLPPGRFTTTNEPLKMIIGWAYNYKRPGFSLNEDQIKGGPSWINAERFDMVAKVPDSLVDQEEKKLPFEQWADQVRLMAQSMLAQRFKLKVSYETKQLPIYALVVAKHGPKLTESKRSGPLMRMGMRGQLTAMGAPIGLLAYALSHQPELGGREVIDQTKLKGRYDFTLKWMPEFERVPMGGGSGPGGAANGAGGTQMAGMPPAPGSSDSSGPSIFTAIQQQLGLDLKPERGPVEVLVIDHIRQPTPN